jgi:hypothetical protein
MKVRQNLNIDTKNSIKAKGGCLCGEVKFEIHGELLSILNCHCSKCRRFNGHIGAYTATHRENLIITCNNGLKWYRSILDETADVYRGFCKECGSSLFWDPRESDNISITAGSIDEPTNLKTSHHVWVSQKGDYYEIDDDLPQHSETYVRN